MSDVWAPGICRWFRARALPRVIARACALALVLNMFAPILWAAAAPAPDADAPMACHEMAPGDAMGHAADHSKPAESHAPHCPLCVLFGGTAWAPPVAAVVLATVGPRPVPAATMAPAPLRVSLPSTLRPSPRAPPL